MAMLALKVMERETFNNIMREYNYPQDVIDLLWTENPYMGQEIGEESLRKTAREMAYLWHIQLPENLN